MSYDPGFPDRAYWRDAGLPNAQVARLLAAIHDHTVVRCSSADDVSLAVLVRLGYVRLTCGGMFVESTAAGCAALGSMRSPTSPTDPPRVDLTARCWICSNLMPDPEREFELRVTRVSEVRRAREHALRTGTPSDGLALVDFGVRICATCYGKHVYRHLDEMKQVESAGKTGG